MNTSRRQSFLFWYLIRNHVKRPVKVLYHYKCKVAKKKPISLHNYFTNNITINNGAVSKIYLQICFSVRSGDMYVLFFRIPHAKFTQISSKPEIDQSI